MSRNAMDGLLQRRAAEDPAGPALIDGTSGTAVSWGRLEDDALTLAARLAAQGVGPGDRLASQLPSGPGLAACLHACLSLGAALVPLAAGLPEPELQRLLDASEATALLRRGRRVARLRDSSRGRPAEGHRDALIIFTSGSAGAPKGVRLTVANCVASAEGCIEALGGAAAADRWLLLLGGHRVGGLAVLWRSALTGAPVIHLGRFKEADVKAALAHGPTLTSMVPAMLHRLVAAGIGPQLGTLRAILIGGAPASKIEVLDWVALGLNVCPSYGMSETGSQVAVVPPGRARELAGSAGMVHSRALVETDGNELLVGGPVLSPGYLDPMLTQQAFAGDGAKRRLRTGDLGVIDDGVVTVVGRRDRMIITGGEKVQPQEIEAVLMAHPAVRDASVWGSPDPRYGSVVTAMVVGDADVPSLQAWCGDRLAHYKVPRRFEFADEVPRGEDGKPVAPPAVG